MAKEYIEREAAKHYAKHAYAKGLNVLDYIDEVPAADVVPVVRCKNCLNWKKDAYGGVCDRYGARLDKDWFCAGGEMRKVQHDD